MGRFRRIGLILIMATDSLMDYFSLWPLLIRATSHLVYLLTLLYLKVYKKKSVSTSVKLYFIITTQTRHEGHKHDPSRFACRNTRRTNCYILSCMLLRRVTMLVVLIPCSNINTMSAGPFPTLIQTSLSFTCCKID